MQLYPTYSNMHRPPARIIDEYSPAPMQVVGILQEKSSSSLDLADDSIWVAVAEALRKPLLEKFKVCTSAAMKRTWLCVTV